MEFRLSPIGIRTKSFWNRKELCLGDDVQYINEKRFVSCPWSVR